MQFSYLFLYFLPHGVRTLGAGFLAQSLVAGGQSDVAQREWSN